MRNPPAYLAGGKKEQSKHLHLYQRGTREEVDNAIAELVAMQGAGTFYQGPENAAVSTHANLCC